MHKTTLLKLYDILADSSISDNDYRYLKDILTLELKNGNNSIIKMLEEKIVENNFELACRLLKDGVELDKNRLMKESILDPEKKKIYAKYFGSERVSNKSISKILTKVDYVNYMQKLIDDNNANKFASMWFNRNKSNMIYDNVLIDYAIKNDREAIVDIFRKSNRKTPAIREYDHIDSKYHNFINSVRLSPDITTKSLAEYFAKNRDRFNFADNISTQRIFSDRSNSVPINKADLKNYFAKNNIKDVYFGDLENGAIKFAYYDAERPERGSNIRLWFGVDNNLRLDMIYYLVQTMVESKDKIKSNNYFVVNDKHSSNNNFTIYTTVDDVKVFLNALKTLASYMPSLMKFSGNDFELDQKIILSQDVKISYDELSNNSNYRKKIAYLLSTLQAKNELRNIEGEELIARATKILDRQLISEIYRYFKNDDDRFIVNPNKLNSKRFKDSLGNYYNVWDLTHREILNNIKNTKDDDKEIDNIR